MLIISLILYVLGCVLTLESLIVQQLTYWEIKLITVIFWPLSTTVRIVKTGIDYVIKKMKGDIQ